MICLFSHIAVNILNKNQFFVRLSFQLYLGEDVIYQMRRRNLEPTRLLTEGIFNLPHHIGMVQKDLAFDDVGSYTQQENGFQHS